MTRVAPTVGHFRAAPQIGRKLGAGGEADVFAVDGEAGLAYKRHFRSTVERSRKLAVMVEHPPDVPDDVSLAWPVYLVGAPDHVEGFAMEQVGGGSRSVPLVAVYNPQSRARTAPGFTWRYLLRTALNVARTVEALHEAGYVIGDLNESNLLVDRQARVALVDCDSIQVVDPKTGALFTCPVGRPEYLAPELHGAELATVERRPSADAFALAVLVFHLLLEGRHPYAGRWRGRGDPPDVTARMRARAWPYRRVDPRVQPPPLGLPLSVLPRPVRRLVRRTFTGPASRRPTVAEWADALEAAEAGLRACRRSPQHVVPHGRRCPWCARVDAGLPDPFPRPDGTAVDPRARAGLARRAKAGSAGAWSHVGPWVARPLGLVVGAGVAGARWPGIAPAVVSVLLVPLLVAVSAGPSPVERRRFDPRRPIDRLRWTARALVDAVQAGAVVIATGVLAAIAGAVGGSLLVGGGVEEVVQASSAAVTVGSVSLAPQVVAAWQPLYDRWTSHPRAAAAAAWLSALAVALASFR